MVKFFNDGTSYRLMSKRAIAQWIETVITSEGFEQGEITYIFCSPEIHIGINRQYLGHDYHTDVITFDYTEEGVVGGDIFIDPKCVGSNAESYGFTKREEMLRVLVHGVLHLCGYKDKTEKEQALMRSKEDYYVAIFKSPESSAV